MTYLIWFWRIVDVVDTLKSRSTSNTSVSGIYMRQIMTRYLAEFTLFLEEQVYMLISHISVTPSPNALGYMTMVIWLHSLFWGHRHSYLQECALSVKYALHAWLSRLVETMVRLMPYTGLQRIPFPSTDTKINRRRGSLTNRPNISPAPFGTNSQVVMSLSTRNRVSRDRVSISLCVQ